MSDHPTSRRFLSKILSGALASIFVLGTVLDGVPVAAQVAEIAPRAAVMGDAGAAAVRPVPAMMGAGQGLTVLAAPSSFAAAPSGVVSAALSIQVSGAAIAASAAVPALTPSAAASLAPEVDAPAALTPSAAASVPAGKSQSPTGAAAAPATGRKRAALDRTDKNTARQRLEKIAKAGTADFDGDDSFGVEGSVGPIGKLGRNAPAHDPRTLALTKYLRPSLSGAPSRVNFSAKVKGWGMMLNDKIGDCAIAACGHQIQQWTANAGDETIPSDRKILTAYEAVSGYQPGKPKTDVGSNLLDVMKYWRKTGIGGHKIGAFASIDPQNLEHLRAAVWIFGGAVLGISLPKSAQKQKVWDVPAGGAKGAGKPGSWGGHGVEIAGFSSKGVLVVTWGALKWMTWDFFKTYCDEAYAIISKDFMVDGATPNNHIDLATLKADLKIVTRTPAHAKK